MKHVLVLQHNPFETVGILGEALRARGVFTRVVHAYDDDPVPSSLEEAVGLVVMGGEMSVTRLDRWEFLRDEIALIGSALARSKPVLGICLGSQLLAAALGATVRKGRRKEIGFSLVRLTDAGRSDPVLSVLESPFPALHWHGDVFARPPGSRVLAASDLSRRQAFRYGSNAYGLLCHLEMTEPIAEEMIRTFSGELREEKIDAAALREEVRRMLPAVQQQGRRVYARWAGLIPMGI